MLGTRIGSLKHLKKPWSILKPENPTKMQKQQPTENQDNTKYRNIS